MAPRFSTLDSMPTDADSAFQASDIGAADARCRAIHQDATPQTRSIDALPVQDQLLTFLEHQLHYADQQRNMTDILFEFWLRGARDRSIQDRIREQLRVFFGGRSNR